MLMGQRPIYVDCLGEVTEGEEGPKVYVKTGKSQFFDHTTKHELSIDTHLGLFPSKSTPAPSVELFIKDLEEWEKPIEGAKVYQTQ